MGCLFARNVQKELKHSSDQEKTYSWDDKKKLFLNPNNFIIENLEGQEELRIPGSINGQQFIIQNCKDSTIYILDYLNAVTIDDCINCKIILGPIQGSAFIRNCKYCTCVIACGQFRMRDSFKTNIFLYSATQPIIEASSAVNFGRFKLSYADIFGHLEKANLSLCETNWTVIHDFTPADLEKNWEFLENDSVSDYITEPSLDNIKIELDKLEFKLKFPFKRQ